MSTLEILMQLLKKINSMFIPESSERVFVIFLLLFLFLIANWSSCIFLLINHFSLILFFSTMILITFYFWPWKTGYHSFSIYQANINRNIVLFILGIFSACLLVGYAGMKYYNKYSILSNEANIIPETLLLVIIVLPTAWGLWVWRNRDKEISLTNASNDTFLALIGTISNSLEGEPVKAAVALLALEPFLLGNKGAEHQRLTVHFIFSLLENYSHFKDGRLLDEKNTPEKQSAIEDNVRKQPFQSIEYLLNVGFRSNCFKDYPMEYIDFSGITFQNINFTQNFRCCLFYRSNFLDITATNLCFMECHFSYSKFFASNFNYSIFNDCSFFSSVFGNGSTCEGVKFKKSLFAYATFINVSFSKSSFLHSSFTSSEFAPESFSKTIITPNFQKGFYNFMYFPEILSLKESFCDFSNTQYVKSYFQNAKFYPGADFSSMIAVQCNFPDMLFKNANFANAYFYMSYGSVRQEDYNGNAFNCDQTSVNGIKVAYDYEKIHGFIEGSEDDIRVKEKYRRKIEDFATLWGVKAEYIPDQKFHCISED